MYRNASYQAVRRAVASHNQAPKQVHVIYGEKAASRTKYRITVSDDRCDRDRIIGAFLDLDMFVEEIVIYDNVAIVTTVLVTWQPMTVTPQAEPPDLAWLMD